MATRIRRARREDARIVAAVAAETFEMACPPGTAASAIAQFIDDQLSEELFTQRLSGSGHVILLADVNGEIAGYTMLVTGDPADPDVAAAVRMRPTIELSKCYVRAQFHGRGVATELMRESVALATAEHLASIWLGVNQQNSRALRFYEKSGFAKVGVKKFLVGDELHDDFVLERPLGQPIE